MRSKVNALRKVYFIRPVGMDGPVKIGVSISPDQRRDTLADWSPWPLEIIAETEGDFRAEQRLHAQFSHLHERREWFRWSPEIAEVVEAINSGTFDWCSITPERKVITGRWLTRETPKTMCAVTHNSRGA
jgi:hypothetical protein